MEEQKEIGILWQKLSKKGNEYFSGRVTIDGKTTEIILFKIVAKHEKSPFYKIIKAEYDESRGKISGTEKRPDEEEYH